ncbi:hypothetical protein BJX76DRAFT_17988 [Aspergillus varians]
MHETFALFPSFPVELQDHIWNLAVRPLPGVPHIHSFYTADHYSNKPTLSESHQADFLALGAGKCFGLAVPRDMPSRGPNRSAYRLDSGLWLACRQSRNALCRYFTRNKLWEPVGESPTATDCPSPDRPIRSEKDTHHGLDSSTSHTASYTDATGQKHYITIQPTQDLVHLLDPFGLVWFHHYAGDTIPLIDAPARGWGAGDGTPGFIGQNVAVDFDPGWVGGVPGKVIDFFDVLYDDAVRTVWLIDYRLRRRRSALGGGDGIGSSDGDGGSGSKRREEVGMVFYAWGYVFTEVKRTQQGVWEVDDGSTGSAFDVFDRLPADTNGRLELEDPSRARVLAREEIAL